MHVCTLISGVNGSDIGPGDATRDDTLGTCLMGSFDSGTGRTT